MSLISSTCSVINNVITLKSISIFIKDPTTAQLSLTMINTNQRLIRSKQSQYVKWSLISWEKKRLVAYLKTSKEYQRNNIKIWERKSQKNTSSVVLLVMLHKVVLNSESELITTKHFTLEYDNNNNKLGRNNKTKYVLKYKIEFKKVDCVTPMKQLLY